jgi:hypothetical protein
MHAATSKVEKSAQGLSCKLKFVHALAYFFQSINAKEEKVLKVRSKSFLKGFFLLREKVLEITFASVSSSLFLSLSFPIAQSSML